ncbi:hypothetical protein HA402_001773 [Bradysia odoriphaga]|nr:hypothetical protein HA402_001773 [Bradysia odoriphaga]
MKSNYIIILSTSLSWSAYLCVRDEINKFLFSFDSEITIELPKLYLAIFFALLLLMFVGLIYIEKWQHQNFLRKFRNSDPMKIRKFISLRRSALENINKTIIDHLNALETCILGWNGHNVDGGGENEENDCKLSKIVQ